MTTQLYSLNTSLSNTEIISVHMFMSSQQSHGLGKDEVESIDTGLQVVFRSKVGTEIRFYKVENNFLLNLLVAHGSEAVIKGHHAVTADKFTKEALLFTDTL